MASLHRQSAGGCVSRGPSGSGATASVTLRRLGGRARGQRPRPCRLSASWASKQTRSSAAPRVQVPRMGLVVRVIHSRRHRNNPSVSNHSVRAAGNVGNRGQFTRVAGGKTDTQKVGATYSLEVLLQGGIRPGRARGPILTPLMALHPSGCLQNKRSLHLEPCRRTGPKDAGRSKCCSSQAVWHPRALLSGCRKYLL